MAAARAMSEIEIKQAVRERDGFKCRDCGMTNEEHIAAVGTSLHVHRVAPGSEYSLDGCETLCVPCHSKKPKSPWGSGRYDGVDLRADPEWVARVTRQAKRLGVSVSGYIRQATTRQLEEDESQDPSLRRKR